MVASNKWIISACDYLRHESGIIRGEFVEAGILETLSETDSAEAEDPLPTEGDSCEDCD